MCKCEKEGIEVSEGMMYYTDCEGILRSFDINFCPFCGENFQPERSKREDLIECVLCKQMHDNESQKQTCEDCHYKIVKKIHQDAVL